jgi:hypothetical protein
MTDMIEASEDTRRTEAPDLKLNEAEPLSDTALELTTHPIVILDQMTTNALADLGAAQFAFDAAVTAFERRTSRQYYRSDLAHAAAVEERTPEIIAALEAAGKAADAVYQQARNLEAATSADREPVLSDADMQRASSRMGFAKEDCQDLPLAELRAKIQHAIQTSDTALCWLYFRYAPARLQERRQADLHAGQERDNVRQLLDSLRGRLVDTRPRQVHQKAKDVRKQAVAFMRKINEAGNKIQPGAGLAPQTAALYR